MMDRTITLETDRVRIEPLCAVHMPDLIRNADDPALWEFTYTGNPFTNERDAERWFDESAVPGHLTFAIVDKPSGETIGSTRYFEIFPEHRRLEIGYTFIARRFWRTHVNTHCKFLLFRYAFEEWGAVRVQLKGEAINMRSRNAMQRIGAAYEGTLRNFRIRPDTGEIRSVSYYSVIAEEWPALKSRLETGIYAV